MERDEQGREERIESLGARAGGPVCRSGRFRAGPGVCMWGALFLSLLVALVSLSYAPSPRLGAEPATRALGPDAGSAARTGPLGEAAPADAPIGGYRPRLVRDIDTVPGEASHPETITNLDGALVFFANDRVVGEELWRSNGTAEGTVLVKDINPGSNGSSPSEDDVTTMAGALYFTASDGTAGGELWSTDGTAEGTVRVKDIRPGPAGSSPAHYATFDGGVYFAADDGIAGRELWRSNGTEAGTMRVRDIEPGANGSNPSSLTEAGGLLYFRTNGGAALWKTDGTEAGTAPVKDINPAGNDSVFGLTTLNGTLYFSACDNVAGCELWKTDGTENGTVRVKDIQAGRESGGAYLKRSVGGVLYVSADDGVNGTELWKTDGTTAGTVPVKDINPGSNGSTPKGLRDIDGVLYFTADDGVSGRELWRSDGTDLGTSRVKDIRSGVGDSGDVPGNGPWGLTSVNGILFFSACDDLSGCELWKTDGTEAGTARVTDIAPGNLSSGPSDHTNRYDVLYFAADNGTSGEELYMLDPTPPLVAVPDSVLREATGPAGAVVTYEVTARDNFDGPIAPTCSPASGAMVPLGTTTVACTASDSSGNVATGQFPVTVHDTTAATWPESQDVVAEATGPNGANVTFGPVAADAVDPSPIVNCTPASGTLFRIGDTPVSCTARDASGNLAATNFTVRVQDTTSATLSTPGDIVVEATGQTGAAVTYDAPVASDVVDPDPMVSCYPASGETFPLGTTEVACTASDASGNDATLSFNVTVRDTTRPTFNLQDVRLKAQTSSGMVVVFQATAQDAVDPNPVVSCNPASGSSFPIGVTTVTCTASDATGNVASGSFRVTIEAPDGIAVLGAYVDSWLLLVAVGAAAAAFLVGRAWVRKRRRDRDREFEL